VKEYIVGEGAVVVHADCLDFLRTLADNSIDSVVTDPPYGLGDTSPENVAACLAAWLSGDEHEAKGGGFMGKTWDSWVPGPAVWKECLRVLKPGGHLLAFAGSRTLDLMGISLRLAGFEVRDSLQWLYGTGFPKSLNVSKAIDKAAGATPEAEQWDGWGTALKPAAEPVLLCRKPLNGTVAANVLTHGVGALNVDGCRVATGDDLNGGTYSSGGNINGLPGDARTGAAAGMFAEGGGRLPGAFKQPEGRWPPNVLFTHTPNCDGDNNGAGCVEGCAVGTLGGQSGEKTSGSRKQGEHGLMGYGGASAAPMPPVKGSSPTTARFFPSFRYVAKPGKKERDAGVQGPVVTGADVTGRQEGSAGLDNPRAGTRTERKNTHTTVKPIDLMRWLVRLVTPPGGVVLDPFCGSGTTGCAAVQEGVLFLGVEREEEYAIIAKDRIEHWSTT
jgi:DNA modification methylase